MPPSLIESDTLLPSLDPLLLVEAIRAGHQHEAIPTARSALEDIQENGEINHFISLTAWQPGTALGAKLSTVFPANERLGHGQNIHSVFVLFDGENGALLGVITGDSFTRYKTAADSALGASILARSDATNLVVLGAGSQAEPHIRLMCAVRPSIKQVTIWNRTESKARALTDNLSLPGVKVASTTDLESAVRAADIVTCITSASKPVLKGAWLQPGTHVDLVGAFTDAMRESDDETMRRGRIFLNNPALAMASGDISAPIATGVISASSIAGDLFDLCTGRVAGRTSAAEITIYKNAGGGHLDLMVARALYKLSNTRADPTV
ncbi:ornithine cyclodeaminase family protein [Phaeovulum sp.]|uniref:ornithine cyclodeaminase family protein n=1 Tax=Phaeovulum sp. TaxID=2934796 RepID=UPI0039E3C4E0